MAFRYDIALKHFAPTLGARHLLPPPAAFASDASPLILCCLSCPMHIPLS